MRMYRSLVTLIIAALAACASTPQKPAPAAAPEAAQAPAPDLAAYETAWAEVMRLEKANAGDEARKTVARVISLDDFGSLPEAVQYKWLHHAGDLAIESKAFDAAYALFKITTGMSLASEDDWGYLFASAEMSGARADAFRALAVTAQRWPAKLESFNPQFINRALFGGDARTDRSDARFEALDALYGAKWKLDFGFEPSEAWTDLVRLLLERGDVQRAIDVSARITAPRALLAMRVDKRYDAVVRAVPERFDVDLAMARQIAVLKKMSADSPRRLALKMELIYGYLEAAQYEQALTLADAVLKDESRETAYDDYEQHINWILDTRGFSLLRLGRWGEAQRNLEQAAALLEDGKPNVSNAINLGGLHAEFGRSREALAALGSMAFDPEGVSGYGGMQVHHVMLRAALASRDTVGVKDALDYMREHQSDAWSTFQTALVDANELEAAASLLIRRLKDPALRGAALSEMQVYRDGALSPVARTLAQRWLQVKARPDVQAALAEVGRIEKVSLGPPLS